MQSIHDEDMCSNTNAYATAGEPTTAACCNGERQHQERDILLLGDMNMLQSNDNNSMIQSSAHNSKAATLAQHNLSTMTRLAGSAFHINCVITQVAVLSTCHL